MKTLNTIFFTGLLVGLTALANCKSNADGCSLEDPVCNPLLLLLSAPVENHYLFTTGDNSSFMGVYQINSEDGTLTEMGFSSVRGRYYTELVVSPTSDSIYAVSSDYSQIDRLDIDGDGMLSLNYSLETPYAVNSVAISPLGNMLFTNQYSGDDNTHLNSYIIDAGNGELNTAGEYTFIVDAISLQMPVTQGIVVNGDGSMVYSPHYFLSGIQAVSVDDTGSFKAVTGTPFEGSERMGASMMHPDGKLLYTVNAANSVNDMKIYAHSVENNFGFLTELSSTTITGPTEQGQVIDEKILFDSSGKYMFVMVNKPSDNLYVYGVNETTGELTAVNGSPYTAGLSPEDIVLGPEGKNLFVSSGNYDNTPRAVNPNLRKIISYRIAETGALTENETYYMSLNTNTGRILVK